MTPGGALLVAGTTSDAGKSMVVAGLCRLLARKGIRVAPFKAQNMSNNSAVTTEGGEIGRAQAMQARAAGLAPSVRFNPILLKPGSDRTSQLVLRGQVVDTVSAKDYFTHRDRLSVVVADELQSLRNEFDAVICEGAGSPAEINLRATDLANMGLARAANLPVILVGDIDRGGLLAHLYGTVAVLEPEDQQLISGFVVNKFRGDPTLLAPGLAQLETLTGRPHLRRSPVHRRAVARHRGFGVGARTPRGRGSAAATRATVASGKPQSGCRASRTPPTSRRWPASPAWWCAGSSTPRIWPTADVVVIPGSKATVADLGWLRDRGLADGIVAHAAQDKPVLGICGGFQMLCRHIDDPVESGARGVTGLGLLDADIVFAPDKTLRHHEAALHGYEIHHGQLARSAEDDWLGVGIRRGTVYGTHWHGVLDNDELRRRWLTETGHAGVPRRRRHRRPGAARRATRPDG